MSTNSETSQTSPEPAAVDGSPAANSATTEVLTSPENPFPRTAADWVSFELYYAQQHFDWTSDHLSELLAGDRAAYYRNVRLKIAEWVNVYLWEVVRRYAPAEIAAHVAGDISDACFVGDSMGEWLWDWQQQYAAGRDLRLPFEEPSDD